MDLSTIVGIGCLLLLVLLSLLMGTPTPVPATALIGPPSLLLLLVGTATSVTLSFGVALLKRVPPAIRRATRTDKEEPDKLVEAILQLSGPTLSQGLTALTQSAPPESGRFFREAAALIALDLTPEQVRSIHQEQTALRCATDEAPAAVVEAAGWFTVRVSFVIIVVGLITVLSRLESPSMLGYYLSFNFLTLLYGLAFAYLLAHPLARKIRYTAQRHAARTRAYMEAILAVYSGEPAALTRQRVATYLEAAR